MIILVGTYALRKLEILNNGFSNVNPKDFDLYIIGDDFEDYIKANFILKRPVNFQNTDNIVYIDTLNGSDDKFNEQTNIIKYYIDKYNPKLFKENEYFIADPIILSLTYLNRIKISGYSIHNKYKYDVIKLRSLKSMYTTKQNVFIESLLNSNECSYKNDWSIYYENELLYLINILPHQYIICNEYAIMFYYEQYLNKRFNYTSSNIDVYGDYPTKLLCKKLNEIGFSLNTLTTRPKYNTFNLHKTFKIETISSLLDKYKDEEIIKNLTYIQKTFNIL